MPPLVLSINAFSRHRLRRICFNLANWVDRYPPCSSSCEYFGGRAFVSSLCSLKGFLSQVMWRHDAITIWATRLERSTTAWLESIWFLFYTWGTWRWLRSPTPPILIVTSSPEGTTKVPDNLHDVCHILALSRLLDNTLRINIYGKCWNRLVCPI